MKDFLFSLILAALSPGRALIALICFLVMASFVMWAVVVAMERVDSVNAKLPPDRQFEPNGWHPAKRLRFEREYVRLFPDKKTRRNEYLLYLAGAIALIAFGIAIGPAL